MDRGKTADRFNRQVELPEIGQKGQRALSEARVFMVGAGGLASAAGYYLAAAGIGKIGIADDDMVDKSNLNRQILHTASRIGRPKADSAKRALQGLNPDLVVELYPQRLDSAHQFREAFSGYDLVVDCTDNFASRYKINQACLQIGKPWFHGAVYGFEGHAATFVPGRGPCYQCLYPSPPEEPGGLVPVIGVATGVIGIIQAAEAIKYVLGAGSLLIGRLLFVDLLEMNITELKFRENRKCPACRKACQADQPPQTRRHS